MICCAIHIPSSDVEEDIELGESSNDEGMGGVSLWGYTAEGEEVRVRSCGGVKANLTDLNLDCDLGWGLSLSESVHVCPVSLSLSLFTLGNVDDPHTFTPPLPPHPPLPPPLDQILNIPSVIFLITSRGCAMTNFKVLLGCKGGGPKIGESICSIKGQTVITSSLYLRKSFLFTESGTF